MKGVNKLIVNQDEMVRLVTIGLGEALKEPFVVKSIVEYDDSYSASSKDAKSFLIVIDSPVPREIPAEPGKGGGVDVVA